MASSTAKHRAQTVALKRHKIVQRYCELKNAIGSRQACKAVKKSPVTLWRWRRALAAHGPAGLVPRINPGRRSAAAGVHFHSRVIRTLESLILQTGSIDGAWQQFKASPDCPLNLATLKIKGMPAPLVRLVKLTPLQQGCNVFLSADGQRLFVRLAKGAALTTKLSMPVCISMVNLVTQGKG